MVAKTLVLASASPRRQTLLRLLQLPHQVHPVHVDETPLPDEPPQALAIRLSQAKARRAAQETSGLILAADTVVALDGRVLGKPRDVGEARSMLRALRDRWHLVYTAITLVGAVEPGRIAWERSAVDAARVHIRPFTDEELEAYLASGDPFDKAGAYAIQHPTFRPVDRIDGCQATVMGLPVRLLVTMLREMGGPEPPDPTRACRIIWGTCCQLVDPSC